MQSNVAPLIATPAAKTGADYHPAALPAAHIPVAAGDGIGPEIMEATLAILKAADPALTFHPVTVGLKAYEAGLMAGIGEDTWQAIAEHKIILKGPITTPQGGGYKSVNVTLRKTLGLYANLRPCVSYHPYVSALHPRMDVVIVRENEEDTYAGIEHRQSQEVVQCLKLITRPGCERIVRYAFDYARANGRKKVTCMTKDNIMKLTDGLFHKVFDEIAAEYPDIATSHMIIDIGTARMASRPTDFDVVVTPNLYGDILSDVAAEVAGSIGLAGSSNIGRDCAMFEAVHGSAPDIAGQDIANPSGLLLSAVMMLVHLGRAKPASDIHNAWLCALEEGLHTADIYRPGVSREKLGTRAFAEAVIARLGRTPVKMAAVTYPDRKPEPLVQAVATVPAKPAAKKELAGVDVFLNWDDHGRDPNVLGQALADLAGPQFRLALVTNRGVKVYPNGNPQTLCTDHWRCRFPAAAGRVDGKAIAELLLRIADAGFDAIKTENLYTFDGVAGYSQAQGE
ncbi:NADP-dependent isocitrate dehydrogenase [Microvirga tunisiensis]|uniref:NADP-dependent isocitrate dehydrogenase n=2 Tax=Pannonibacter tanglangensis TaxID=2750084 RepID=A0ABW9ZQ12_9HYPH|nr:MULTISPECIES: NADP-dependent isocitrate dehydrogenase [unclassified Pannonibacter]NBN64815.1 NADP-dependent isocitrate dehydrogenase [Pannonibacter sp. XCT-34]NBN79316.1 NADP-dependent isocitrate dehydrogenase [Pannonibacter sp. XCT-53]